MKFSFIVVGRNEGGNLSRCLESIIKTIKVCRLHSSEIIYVDSNSNDDSILIARSLEGVSVYQITENYNSANARNLGFKKSEGEILIFADGDMELNPDFFNVVIKNDKLIYPFISGQFINYYYNQNGRLIKTLPYHKSVIKHDKLQYTTGGLFAIERGIWALVNGMRTDFRRSQDLDLGMRLAKKGILLLRKKETMANHHTISYIDKMRVYKDIKSGNPLYRGVLFKKNIFNKYAWQRFIKSDFSILILLLFFSGAIKLNNYYFLMIYPCFLILAGLYKYRKSFNLHTFIFYIVKDLMVIYSILFFYPQKKDNPPYKVIKP